MSLTTYLSSQGFRIEENTVYACNGVGLKHMLRAGKQWLEAHVNVVNGLNVFPVPDGDTGTNMYLTIRSALDAADLSADSSAGAVAASAAHGALLGARGNSGVILSQFFQGMANGLHNKPHFTTEDLAHATGLGMSSAYQSVLEPVEGTILTVARAMAEAARQSAEASRDLISQLANMVDAARVAQASTPDLLPVLKEAGVTDSGGQGLLFMLEGWLRFVRNESVEQEAAAKNAPALKSLLGVAGEEFGYDVQYLINGNGLDVAGIRSAVGRLGWSTVVVGDSRTVKVHVHVTDPGVPISYGAELGVLSDVVVENLTEQARTFVAQRAAAVAPETATVAVVPGNGLGDVFTSLGVTQIVPGGQSMNPSTRELLDVIDSIGSEHVLILPNNGNIILTAQQVQKLSDKNVQVVPTRTVPQGVAALLAFNAATEPAQNVQRMTAAAQDVVTLEITRAVRNTTVNGLPVEAGALIGLVDGKLVSAGQTAASVVLDALSGLAADDFEIVTLYYGEGASAQEAAGVAGQISARFPHLETEIHSGGQPHYPYIISVE
ncbi:MAG: DAK2 domain-containing protein [Chloroflexi bacterium]|nr:MAG: DAK2 domain-containing protein [Chloroflexota bacterium]